MWDAIWEDGHFKYGKLDPDVARLWVRNIVRPKDEPVTWRLDARPSPTIGAHQAAKLSIAPYGVPQKQIDRQQWHTKGNRQGDTPPVDVEYEFLSDGELLMLQTFPRHRYLYGTRMERARQIGNAVPPLLGKVVGEAIAESMKESQIAKPKI
jgi:DNA (cytosine-5)-methyltransferase 1